MLPNPGTLRKIMPLDRDGTAILHVWTDVCNVYVLQDGAHALLIDLGDGSVLDHLAGIGVDHLDWILFTHHHREQCQGYPRLGPWDPRIGAPEAERALFEQPVTFRTMTPALDDPFTVYGASYVRPSIHAIPLDCGFSQADEFVWRGYVIRCVETKGNSPGSMSYLLKVDGRWLAFSGDVMLQGARMHTWFDTEWDYGYGAGLYALASGIAGLQSFDPLLLLPSHGDLIRTPKRQLVHYQQKLERLAALLLRGYRIDTFATLDQDLLSTPTAVPHVWRVSPHLFKFRGSNYWPNMHLLVADSGHALAIDCGLFDRSVLDRAIEQMRERLGLTQIDACVITHVHGDHMLNVPHLRARWGAQVWALDTMVDKMEHPDWFDYVALVQAYGTGITSVPVDRVLTRGEVIRWEGYTLTVDWMPGQTEFALCLHGLVDGRKVAFTGDNICGNPADPAQDGHEAVVARNSSILEEGYLYAARYLTRLQPDLILGGHSWVLHQPAPLIARYRTWASQMRAALRAISSVGDYRSWYDPYWVRAEPYRLVLKRGQSAPLTLHLRNLSSHRQRQHIAIHTPAGLSSDPALWEGDLAPEVRDALTVRLQASEQAPPGLHIVAFDITRDGQRLGEWFDCIVLVSP